MLKKIHIHTKQQDSADCGTACVMSLLNFYDNYLNYQYLRDILKTDTTGTRSSSMIHSLQNLGFEAKLVRLKQLNVVSMQKIVYPCIAHTFVAGLEHYIVLYGLKKNRLIVSDPQKEKICLVSFDEFISSFTGVIILAYPSLSTSLISPMQKKKIVQVKKYGGFASITCPIFFSLLFLLWLLLYLLSYFLIFTEQHLTLLFLRKTKIY